MMAKDADIIPQSGHVRLVGALAGFGSGITKVAVGHRNACSFDTVKTRMQCAPPGTYRGAIDVVTQTIRNEGYRALFKGMTPPMVAWSGVDALLMASLHNYRLMLIRLGMTETNPHSGQPRLTIFAHGVAGLMAGCTSTILGTPMEHLKVRLQMQMQRGITERDFKGPIDCVRRVIQVQGVRGLWSGFTGSLAFRSNFFWMFLSVETLMRVFSESQYIQLNTGTSTFLAGGLASFVYWTMAMPADNLKNRMMAYPYPARYPASRSPTFKIPSIRTVAQTIYRTEGPKGFFRGLTPSLLRAFPANACALYVYETTMSLLDAEKTRH